MDEPAASDGTILLSWLNLLGWQVRVARDGGLLVGVASHVTSDDVEVRVAAIAPTDGELAWQLFEAVVRRLEQRPQRVTVAA